MALSEIVLSALQRWRFDGCTFTNDGLCARWSLSQHVQRHVLFYHPSVVGVRAVFLALSSFPYQSEFRFILQICRDYSVQLKPLTLVFKEALKEEIQQQV